MDAYMTFDMNGLDIGAAYSVTYGRYTEFFHSDEHMDSDTLDALDWLFECMHKLHISGREQ